MIGVFNYTVILTYISLASAITGLILGSNGSALGVVICMLVCGFCDMYDGKIARTKKDRTLFEKSFGVEIDSLSDLIAFGILPVSLGFSIGLYQAYFIPIYIIFVLSGLIRLAYFNAKEYSESNKSIIKSYVGLPITCSAFICPIIYLFRGLNWFNLLYSIVLIALSVLFVCKIRIRKPNKKLLFIFSILGIIEMVLIFL